MDEVTVVKTGHLTHVSKAEDAGPGSASFVFAREGEYDKDGDLFKAGSLALEREKGTLVDFEHSSTPAGVWTLSRDGSAVMANVDFLDTQAGQDTRKYLAAMGESAQFSFRARSSEWKYDDNYGMVFDKATVYEASPVLVGAGNGTKLETIKSLEGRPMDPKEIEALKELHAQNAEALKTLTGEQATALKTSQEEIQKALEAVGETLKGVGDTMTAVKDAVTPAEPKADPMGFNLVKSYGQERPVHDLAKAMFGDGDFKARMESGSEFSLEKNVGVDLIKQSINSFGTIQAAPAVQTITTPIGALDTSYVMPWASEVYRRRVIARTTPTTFVRTPANTAQPPIGGDNFSTSGTGVASNDFPMRTIAAAVPISRLSAMADASVLTAYTEMGLMDLRVQLQDQILDGAGTGEALTSLDRQYTDTDTAASGDTAKGILNGTKGLYQAILAVRGRGGSANYVFAGAADVGKIYTSLTNQRSPFLGTQQFPYGAPMGAMVVLSPQMAANTMVVASMGEPRMHVVPIMGSFRVNVSYETRLDRDEILMTFVVYAQSVVQNVTSGQVIKATNILTAE